MGFVRVLLALALLAGVGCKKKQKGMIYLDGPGSKADLAYLKENWGVSPPGQNPYLAMRGDRMMLYMSTREELPAYQAGIARAWTKLGPDQRFAQGGFRVEGGQDQNVEYAEWQEDGKRKFIFVDLSAALVTYMVDPR